MFDNPKWQFRHLWRMCLKRQIKSVFIYKQSPREEEGKLTFYRIADQHWSTTILCSSSQPNHEVGNTAQEHFFFLLHFPSLFSSHEVFFLGRATLLPAADLSIRAYKCRLCFDSELAAVFILLLSC